VVAAQVNEPVNKDQSTNPSTRMGYCGIRPGRADVQIETPGFTDFGSRFKRREHIGQPFGHTQLPKSAAMHSRQTFEQQQQVQRPQSAAIHRQPSSGIRMGFTTLSGTAVLWPGPATPSLFFRVQEAAVHLDNRCTPSMFAHRALASV